MILKSDGKPSITALVTAVQKEWAGDCKDFHPQLIPRTSHVDFYASKGAVEAMMHSLEGLTRTSKEGLGRGSGNLDPAYLSDPAVAGETSELPTKPICVRACGRTSFEELTMSKIPCPLINTKEAVLAKESGAREGKLGSAWDLGIWLGRSTRTNVHLVGTKLG